MKQQHPSAFFEKVLEENMEKWFPPVPDQGFESIDCKTELKKRLLGEVFNRNSPCCYLFYGLPGTGKTHMARAMARELTQQGFQFMLVDSSTIHTGYAGMAENNVAAAFAIAEEKAPCLLFVDEIHNICLKRDDRAEGHEKRLTAAFLDAYKQFQKSGKPVIFIGATDRPLWLDEELWKNITLIPFSLSTKEERVSFFKRIIFDAQTNQQRLSLEDGFTVEDMAEVTDDYSYRDLDCLKYGVLAKLKAQVIEEYAIMDQSGELDKQSSYKQAGAAIRSGRVKLTREIFEKTRKENVSSDKSQSHQQLKEFEERVRTYNG